MERETGIEPVTSSLGSWRSTAELLPLNLVRLPLRFRQDNGPLSASGEPESPASAPEGALKTQHLWHA